MWRCAPALHATRCARARSAETDILRVDLCPVLNTDIAAPIVTSAFANTSFYIGTRPSRPCDQHTLGQKMKFRKQIISRQVVAGLTGTAASKSEAARGSRTRVPVAAAPHRSAAPSRTAHHGFRSVPACALMVPASHPFVYRHCEPVGRRVCVVQDSRRIGCQPYTEQR